MQTLVEPSTPATPPPQMERLVFGWWNTSLSPVGINRSSDNDQKAAGEIVKWLIDDQKVDCLALGEVREADLILLKKHSSNPDLAIYNGTEKRGKLQFDTGMIYNARRLAVDSHISFTTSHAGQNSKIANRIDFISISDNSVFNVFVSHWPCQTYGEDNKLRRKTLATTLRDKVKSVYEQSPNASIILMGDFNDEPFDESLSHNLLATRDRHLVVTKNGFLYNPFWSHIGESDPYVFGNIRNGSSGSCYSKSATYSRWRTFDQIMFSPAFLGSGIWHLNEEKTKILRNDSLVELVQNNKVHFDHLPIICAIERKVKII